MILLLLLTACGGGSGGNSGSSDAGSPTGLWKGNSDTDRTILGMIMGTDEYWQIYTIAGNSSVLAGVVQGSGIENNGSFTSSNGVDVNMESGNVSDVTMDADYTGKTTFKGALSYPSPLLVPMNSFSTAYDSDYENTASLTTIAGAYDGTGYSAVLSETSRLIISSTGDITGSTGAKGSSNICTINGTITPRTTGNFYDVSINFINNSGGCTKVTDTLIGVAYFDSTIDALTVALLNQTRTTGFLFSGSLSSSSKSSVGYNLATGKPL